MSMLSKQFAERLRRFRLDRNLNQKSIADVIGVTAGHVSNMETCKSDPRLSEIEGIAAYLKMNPLTLLAGLSEDTAELVERLSSMDAQKRKLTLKLFNVSLELMEVSKNWPADSVNGR